MKINLSIYFSFSVIFIGKTSACEEYRPHPNGDCQAFILCVNNAEIIMRCGPGTVFNPIIHVCDYPYNVQCPESKPSTPKVTTPPVITTTTLTQNDREYIFHITLLKMSFFYLSLLGLFIIKYEVLHSKFLNLCFPFLHL